MAGLVEWWKNNRTAITYALVVFLAIRTTLTLIVFAASAYLPQQDGLHYVFTGSHNPWLTGWARWDSEWYIDIARNGYPSRSDLIAFYPLYPFLMSAVSPLFRQNYVVSGVVISSLACFIGFIYLFKLAAMEFGKEVAERAVLYLAVFPMSFFLLAVYTESLFLTITLAAFYHARRAEWHIAALAAFLAPLTRSNGILLFFPLMYEAWSQAGGTVSGLRVSFRHSIVRPALAVLAAPVGFALWTWYTGWLTQDPLAFMHRVHQPPWDRGTSMPWSTILQSIRFLASSELSALSRVVNTGDLIVAVMLIELSVVGWWLLPRVYAVYLTASTILLLSSNVADYPLQSLPRYTLVLFPCFLILAKLGDNSRWERTLLVISAPLLGFYAALFATSYWVF